MMLMVNINVFQLYFYCHWNIVCATINSLKLPSLIDIIPAFFPTENRRPLPAQIGVPPALQAGGDGGRGGAGAHLGHAEQCWYQLQEGLSLGPAHDVGHGGHGRRGNHLHQERQEERQCRGGRFTGEEDRQTDRLYKVLYFFLWKLLQRILAMKCSKRCFTKNIGIGPIENCRFLHVELSNPMLFLS